VAATLEALVRDVVRDVIERVERRVEDVFVAELHAELAARRNGDATPQPRPTSMWIGGPADKGTSIDC